MKFLSLLKNTDVRSSSSSSSSSSSWAWPPCRQPKTLSFRAKNGVVFKTINSAFLDATMESPESFFTEECGSFSTFSEDSRGVDSIETLIRGLRSDRLFFEPDETRTLFEAKASSGTSPFKDSVVMSMDSHDPYVDFRKSMEEIVETHGFKDWESLEDLLFWYLKANDKNNHGFIVNAFVDLLVDLAFTNSCSSSSSSPLMELAKNSKG
ncbi:transcription repressor OFP13-like [Gastrolobium bilobum]|uniref:transcription repressor OFP13-like n=1 Tax=Gastrolobium bilobum TaxID=150636 RepID=UPI002AB2F5E0|nr:transcription repressor OFP13-like [Gastrolobium bilobum]